jgi:1,4-dihydroxy-6-naphthoate synthase
MKDIIVAHSPDADDIFMYYAIKFGWVGLKGINFINKADDIESLNVAALNNVYDICAISFALYPFIKDDYALLQTATSFGDGYGPKLIKKKGKILKKNFTVALSGKYTTNAMLFKAYYPKAKIIYKNFLDIEKAILNDEVDAGVLIHESILTYDNSLEVEAEIYDIWIEFAKEQLPLPLGGMVLKRSIPIHLAIHLEQTLTKAVQVAHNNKSILSKMLLERDLIRVDSQTLNQYLLMYANESSIKLNDLQIKALDKLYQIGYEKGFYKECLKTKDYFIPHQYNELRFS